MPTDGFGRAAVLCAATLFTWAGASAQLTEPQQRGHRIYLEGTSASGRAITATLADGSSMPASVLVCGGCHGEDGQGRSESGVIPPDITWPNLTKPYGHVDADGQTHPPYADPSLERAIRIGADSAGNSLSATMPRYRMAAEDMADLLAYVRVLGQEVQPGVTAAAVRIGAVLGSDAAGESVGKLLAAYFDTVNGSGGVYGRRLELIIIRPAAAVELARVLEESRVFALVSSVAPGLEREITAAAGTAGVPLAGLITFSPETISGGSVFLVLPGIREQVRALLAFAAEDGNRKFRGAVVHSSEEGHRETASALDSDCRNLRCGDLLRSEYRPGSFDARATAVALSKHGVTHVLMLAGAAEQREFARQAAALGWRPTLLMPASIVDREILANPGSFERVVLAFPTIPAERADGSEFLELLRGHNLPLSNPAFQTAAYCGARMLIEGLMRAGRQLTRARLVTALESLRDYDAGVGPPLSFGPNRRIAASGAHLVSLLPKLELSVVREWLPVE